MARSRTSAEAAARIDWNQAIALLRSGRVLAVTQLHDLTVTLTTDEIADAVSAALAAKKPAIVEIAVEEYFPTAAPTPGAGRGGH